MSQMIVNLSDENVRYDVKSNTIFVKCERTGGSYPQSVTIVGKHATVDFEIDIEEAMLCEFWDGEFTILKPVNENNVLKSGVQVIMGYCV